MGNSKSFYILDDDIKNSNETNKWDKDGDIDILVICPTLAAVKQTRSEIEQDKSINKGQKKKIQSVWDMKRVTNKYKNKK